MDEPFEWITKHTELVHENPWFSVRKDSVVRPDGKPGDYFVVSLPTPAVVIIPVDLEGNIVLVGQSRYPVGKYLYEFPAGAADVGEEVLEAAKRELREETGYDAEKWELLGAYFMQAGIMGQEAFVFLAQGLREGVASPDGSEDIRLKSVSLDEVRNLSFGSELTNFSLSPLAFYERWLRANEH
ncbi:MAG: NUDIX hydrolase [Candidatus Moranbacteria bacterium]|nr:NUDIX hydrolase [Candidatus Moranbacteria bacterium]NTW45658.1 NUDIX hydrolase [Candidatus Moranbacteria bacterium]